MREYTKIIVFNLLFLLLGSCTYNSENDDKNEVLQALYDSTYTLISEKNYVSGYEPLYDDGEVNVVVEIPAGTNAKWEVDKPSGTMKWEFVNGQPRIVDYLGYPGNYGMIPKTFYSPEMGGDGDPLDVIVLGPAVERGSVVKCKIIGVLEMLDRGEQDDKLIAVQPKTHFYYLDDIDELKSDYKGIVEILKVWFENYKGEGYVEVMGYGNREKAEEILNNAINCYKQ